MKQITASEALEKSLNSKKYFVELPDRMIETINKRIEESCESGKFRCSLKSIDNSGNLVRGIGLYLNPEILESISEYYSKYGFRIEYIISPNAKLLGITDDAYLVWDTPPGDE